MTSDILVERRGAIDRRSFGWRTVMYGFLRSRRRSFRRTDETEVRFLDWHHPWLFFLAVGTMTLSSTDAFMTLLLLDAGMVEVNPVMAHLLGHSPSAFAISKLALTGTGILVLVYLAKARFLNRLRTGIFLTIFFSGYCCLVCYQLVSLLATM